MNCILLSFLLLASANIVQNQAKFFTTEKWYNGTIGYDGLFKACEKEKINSKPCTEVQLFNGFWKEVFQPAWILDLEYNCIGYTSDAKNTIGMCVQTVYGKQVIPCSCDMSISVCCYFS